MKSFVAFGIKHLLNQSLTFLLFICLNTNSCIAEEESFKPPFDLLSDVIRPLGMPIVTSYHTMRENVFFNLRTKDKNVLQSIGDFFLVPSQFLFAGKTISFKDQNALDYEIEPSFNYDHFFWLKTLGSIITLPIADFLGIAFKGIAYLSPNVRAQHAKIKQALNTSFTISHLEEYRMKGIETFYCDEFIPCQGHKRPSYLSKKQKLDLDAFKEIIALLEAHNIIYWIDCGTCLGAYRYSGIIPWDLDIDIAIFQSDHENVKRLLSSMDQEKYQIQDWSSYSKPQTFLKLYVKETKNLIDIYHYQFDANETTISYFYSYEDSPIPESWKKSERKCTKPVRFEQVFPLKRAHFDDLLVWAPQNVIKFLQSKYGENLDPSMLWDEENKTYIKVVDHPYWKD